MPAPTPGELLRAACRTTDDAQLHDIPDHDLLRRFLAVRDEAAFRALVLRHGPMVLGVCRAVLSVEADAEDAFQATFLLLARKAGAIRKATSVASWLHGVARRTALKARAESARRRQYEGHAAIGAESADDLSWREVQQVVHEELGALSDRYRGPLTLCYLQGLTLDRAAAILGVAKSTLKVRLERARALLRARLVRRGLGPAAALLASAWPAAGEVPATLLGSTITAALSVIAAQPLAGLVPERVVSLTQGVQHAMFLSKMKVVAVVLAVTALAGLGLGGLAHALTDPPNRPDARVAVVPDDKKPKVARDRMKDRRDEEWERVTGKVKVIDARTLEFEDGTRVELDIVTPHLDQMAMNGDELYPAGKEAAEFLRTLIGDRPVTCFRNLDRDNLAWIGRVGDTAIDHAMVAAGWALASQRPQQVGELTAREAKRGLWRGRFIDPIDWEAGVRLPGEPPPPKLADDREAQKLIAEYGGRPGVLEVVITRIVTDLPDARRLNFARTGLNDDLLGQLTRLTKLEELYLSQTPVTDAGLALVAKFPRLKRLSLPSSSPAVLAHVKGLANLESLLLPSPSAAALQHLKGMTGLKQLDLGRDVTDEGLAHLAGLINLEVLHLGYAAITDDGLRHLKDMQKLRRLSLYNTKISDAGLFHLRGLKSLTILDVHQCRLTDAGMSHLKDLANLEYINATGMDVRDAGALQLIGLKRLRVLRTEALGDETKKRLREAIPGIEFDGPEAWNYPPK